MGKPSGALLILGGLFVVLLFLVAILYISQTASPTTNPSQGQVATPAPTATQNPFKGTTNPFIQPTTYQNPFSSTSSGTVEYKNPFNQLQ